MCSAGPRQRGPGAPGPHLPGRGPTPRAAGRAIGAPEGVHPDRLGASGPVFENGRSHRVQRGAGGQTGAFPGVGVGYGQHIVGTRAAGLRHRHGVFRVGRFAGAPRGCAGCRARRPRAAAGHACWATRCRCRFREPFVGTRAAAVRHRHWVCAPSWRPKSTLSEPNAPVGSGVMWKNRYPEKVRPRRHILVGGGGGGSRPDPASTLRVTLCHALHVRWCGDRRNWTS